MPRFRGLRSSNHHKIRVRENLRQLRDRDNFLNLGRVALPGPRYSPDPHVKGICAPTELPTDRTVSNDQQELPVQLRETLRLIPNLLLPPMRVILMAHGIWKISRQGQ